MWSANKRVKGEQDLSHDYPNTKSKKNGRKEKRKEGKEGEKRGRGMEGGREGKIVRRRERNKRGQEQNK